MTGAAYLSAAAALRTGVGLVNLGIPASLNPILEAKITEALTVPLPDNGDGFLSEKALEKVIERCQWADAVVIGPGCGREAKTLQVLKDAILWCAENEKPALIDADALYAISQNRELLSKLTDKIVLTPHHGEFLRMADSSAEKLKQKPWEALGEFTNKTKAVINLKGAPSLVGDNEGKLFINPNGNEGLAKGGSGDALSGLIGGLIARGLPVRDAAVYGNFIHGAAADLLAEEMGTTAMIPSELLDIIPAIIKDLEEFA